MSFEWPVAVVALLVVPLVLVGYLLVQRRPARYALTYTNLDVLASVIDRPSAWRRYLPLALFLAALTALALGLARPEVTVTGTREEATIILAIDSSGSMLADDVRPTRLEAAQAAVRTFLDRLPTKYRVGMVTFAAEAQVVAPVTTDRGIVRESLDYLVPGRGTAIGDAVKRAAELGQEAVGTPDSRVTIALRTAAPTPPAQTGRSPVAILFLSDGFQTAGMLSPLQGAQAARRLGIPVYTIALGTPNGVLELDFEGFRRRIPVPPDRATLRQIAETTGGEYFDAPSARALEAAYEKLGSLLSHEPEELEATFAFVGAGAALLLAAGVLSALWSSRLP
jgi:Ca-activated chloride channel family protein